MCRGDQNEMKYGVVHVSHIFVSQVSQDPTIFKQQYVKKMDENKEYTVREHMLELVRGSTIPFITRTGTCKENPVFLLRVFHT